MKKITLVASLFVLAFSLTKAQSVTTLAGSTTPGSANGTGAAAGFWLPTGVATDGTNLYVADASNNLIRQINISTGAVTTLAGSGSPGNTDGTAIGASFNAPYGIVYDAATSALYVADYNNNEIRKVGLPGGTVNTIAGNGTAGFSDGPSTNATFHNPNAIATDGAGNLYVTDAGNNEIRELVISTGAVTTVAGSPTAGSTDGTGAAAQFLTPSGIAYAGGYLYVADAGNNEIRQVTPSTGNTVTVYGSTTPGSNNGNGTGASFNQPYGIAFDGSSNLYVSDMGNNSIRRIYLGTSAVSTYAGFSGSGATNGTTLTAQFGSPHGLVVDATGDVYIADASNNEIREIGVCSTAMTVSLTGRTTMCYGIGDTLVGVETGGTVGPYSFYWNGAVATDSLFIIPLNNTMYNLTVVDGIGCHSDTANTYVIVDNPGSIVLTNFGSNPICPGTTDMLFATSTGNGGGSYTWTPSVGSVGSPYAGNATPSVTTTYTLSENADANGCIPTPGTITIDVYTSPTVSIVGNVMSGLNICSGSADTLRAIAIGSGPFTYNWSNDGTTDTVIAKYSSEYAVTVTDQNGCQSITADSNVRSNNNPALVVNGNTVVCAGNASNLQVSGAQSYMWAPGGSFGDPTDSVQTIYPGVTTTYTVTGNNGGCKSNQYITVNVSPLPPVSISGPSTVCAGSSINLFGVGADVYQWSGGPNSDGYQVAPLTNTIYTVTGISISTGCSNIATTYIMVNSLPVVTITGPTSVCQGTVTSLTANGADTYQWAGPTGPASQTYSISPQYTTTYVVNGFSSTTGCSDTVSQVVVVNPLPNVYISGQNTICNGSSTALIASGADTYQWTGGPATAIYNITPTSSLTYQVTGTNTTTACSNSVTQTVYVNTPLPISANAYPSSTLCRGGQITLYGGGGSTYSWSSGINDGVPFRPLSSATYTVSSISDGCSVSDTIHITVNTLPVITASASPKDSICQGGSVTLTGLGAVSYSWSNGVTNGVAFNPASSNIYEVTGIDANGCEGSTQIPIVVNNLPSISGSVNPQQVCQGSKVTLNGNGGSTYTWTGGVTNGVAFTPATSGTYTVTGTSAVGCTNTAIVGVTVNPIPVMGDSAIPSTSVCQGNSVALIGKGASSYSWSGGVVNGISFVPTTSGTYTVTGFGANGCTSKDSITIKINNKVILTPLTINTTCALNNGSVKVGATSGTPPYQYSWSTVPVNTTDSIGSLSPGTYIITVSDASHCSSYSSIDIASSTAPILSVSTNESTCGNATGSAYATVAYGTPPYRYSWSNGDTTYAANNLTLGTYIVTITDVNHCTAVGSADISNQNGPSITANAVVNVNCNGQTTGAITIGVNGGAVPYTFVWSNGATTQNISGLAAGPYQVTVSDANGCSALGNFTISQPTPLVLSKSIVKADCGVPDGAATVTVNGGVPPYSYLWNNGRTSDSIATVNAGAYYVTILDHNGCRIDSDQVSISNINGPVPAILITGSASCNSGGVTLTENVTGGTAPYNYLWSTGKTSTSISQIPAGKYNLKVTDHLGCVGVADTTIFEVPPPVAPICMVTVDSATQKNMVIWNKYQSSGIASYNIYKETTQAGVYQKIGNVPYPKKSVFIDTLSNPQTRSWRYKLSEVDSCGNESALSPDHKTMHLTVNKGVGGTVNLIWDNYEGFTFYSYYVYRDTNSTSLTLIDSIPNNIFTYTDFKPPLATNLYYRMQVINPDPCMPIGLRPFTINYNAAKSNTGNVTLNTAGISPVVNTSGQLTVFPNPSTGVFTFTLVQDKGSKSVSLSVVNELGQAVMTNTYNEVPASFTKQLDLSSLAKGVYFLKTISDKSILYNKVVIQ